MEQKSQQEQYDILVDIDFKPDVKTYCKQLIDKLTFVYKYMGVRVTDIQVFETAKGYHIYLKAVSKEKLRPIDIVVIQLVLGSDYKREAFNWRRVKGNSAVGGWNTLYKFKFRGDKMVSCEEKTENARIMENTVKKIYIETISRIKCKEVVE